MIRLGIVGAGAIVQSHIDAAKLSGFVPVAVCGRMGSTRAAKIAQQNKGLVAVTDLNALLESKLDAILIAVSTDDTIEVLEKCLVGRLPILVEKPVSTDEKILRKLHHSWGDQVLVGYNRRHYSSTKKFRETLSTKDNGLVSVNISELSLTSHTTKEGRREAILTNSVHILDLMHYLFGDIRLLNSIKTSRSTGSDFLTWQFESSNGYCGNINLLFGAPENQSITQWSRSFFQELRPIEIYSSSDSMHMILPTETSPVKSYKKKLQPWIMNELDVRAKPGFLGEYSEFRELCLGKNLDHRISANLQDAANAVKIAHKIYSL